MLSQSEIIIPAASEPDADKAKAARRQGDEAFVRKDFAAAAEAYATALRHDTSAAAVWANRAAALLRLGGCLGLRGWWGWEGMGVVWEHLVARGDGVGWHLPMQFTTTTVTCSLVTTCEYRSMLW